MIPDSVFDALRQTFHRLYIDGAITLDDLRGFVQGELGVQRLRDAAPHQLPAIWRWADLKHAGDVV